MKKRTFKFITLFAVATFVTLPIGNITKTIQPFPQIKLVEGFFDR